MLDLLYAQAALARRRWFERHPEARKRLRQPVISVGNLSVGGTGKTPLVAQLAEWLAARGERPAILSRGYKRRVAAEGAVVVSDATAVRTDVDHAGDEPLMLARAVPGAIVCIAEDRHLAGVVAERACGATIHLLDDGFQHVQLARDYDILVTSAGEIAEGRVLPRGRLREGRDAAARADFLVVVGVDASAARSEAWELGVSASSGARRRLGALGAPGAPGALGAAGAAGAAGAPGAVAVAGIAQPDQFFALLQEAGVAVARTLPFPDHHRYTTMDVARIKGAVESCGAAVVITTAKDAVRFEPLGELPFALSVAPMRLELDEWDLLTTALDEVLTRARRAA